MTTITRSSTPGAEFIYKRQIVLTGNSRDVVFRKVELTAEQKAEVLQRKTEAAELAASVEKQLLEVEKNNPSRSHAQTTTFSHNDLPSAGALYKRQIVITGKSQDVIFRKVELTAEQKAEVLQRKTEAAELAASVEKQLREIEKNNPSESHAQTTIFPHNALPSAGALYKPQIVITGKSKDVIFRKVELTAEQKAEVLQRKTEAAELAAASEKQRREVEKSNSTENQETYLPNMPRRIISPGKGDVSYLGKGRELTTEQKAEIAQIKSEAAELAAASEKQRREVEKSNSLESHEMYLPNISDLSLENAKKSLGIAQVMIERHEDAGVSVHGRYGDQKISDLNAYKAALTDFISKHETAVSKAAGETPTITAPSSGVDGTGLPGQNHTSQPNVAPQSNTTAASIYRQVQDMLNRDGNKG